MLLNTYNRQLAIFDLIDGKRMNCIKKYLGKKAKISKFNSIISRIIIY